MWVKRGITGTLAPSNGALCVIICTTNNDNITRQKSVKVSNCGCYTIKGRGKDGGGEAGSPDKR